MKWGILGAAKFAREHMGPAIHAASGAELAGLATSDPAKAAGFQAFAPGIEVYDSYDALLADDGIEAVYVPLPNHLHITWARKALEAGKHVLVEKPVAVKAAEIDALIALRDQTGKLAAEAFMITHHPQFERARALVQGGAIGEIRYVDSAFSFDNGSEPGNIRNTPETAGGAMRDIGVYILGATRFVTGAEAVSVPHARIDTENDVDVFVQTAVDFGSFMFSGMVSMRLAKRQHITFQGDAGILTLTCPFNAGVFDQAELALEDATGTRTLERWPGVNHYVLQVEAFGRAARGEEPYVCPLEFSRGTQAAMEQVFAAGGIS